jgi:hypothetical protein
VTALRLLRSGRTPPRYTCSTPSSTPAFPRSKAGCDRRSHCYQGTGALKMDLLYDDVQSGSGDLLDPVMPRAKGK